VFSGIVEGVGTVERTEGGTAGFRLAIRAGFERSFLPGESVSVSGVCLTVERASGDIFEAVAVPETTAKTTLGSLTRGSRVNLERALRIGEPLGGHWVQGHVDAVAPVVSVRREGADVRVAVEIPQELRPYVATKGSIAIDGVSLTVASVDGPVATVALIPYTLEHTIASEYAKGARVNLEVDLVARYLERLLAARGWAPSVPDDAPLPGRTA
jgi:riboflavin synthase alpha subunit